MTNLVENIMQFYHGLRLFKSGKLILPEEVSIDEYDAANTISSMYRLDHWKIELNRMHNVYAIFVIRPLGTGFTNII